MKDFLECGIYLTSCEMAFNGRSGCISVSTCEDYTTAPNTRDYIY